MALSADTFKLTGSAVSDIFGGIAARKAGETSAQGLEIEASNYKEAAKFSRENETFVRTNMQLEQYQTDRSMYQQVGGQRAAIGGSGFADSGTSIYLAMDAAKQGALAKATITQQGSIDIAGYEEQARSYESQAKAADFAANAARESGKDSETAGWISGIASIAAAAFML